MVYLNYNTYDSFIENALQIGDINQELNDIYKVVANDEMEKFKIVLESGDEIAICVQAQMVSAAILQLKDEELYLNWKKVEKNYCSYLDWGLD